MSARALCARFARDESRVTPHHPRISNRYPIIRNRASQLTTNEKTFSNRYFFGRFERRHGDAAPRALPAGLYARVLRGENLHGYHDCWDQEEDGYRDPHQGGGALLVFER
jgi:hypothetical protein